MGRKLNQRIAKKTASAVESKTAAVLQTSTSLTPPAAAVEKADTIKWADVRLAGRINERAEGKYPGGHLSDRDVLFLAYFAEITGQDGSLPLDAVNHANPYYPKSPVCGGPLTRLKNAGLAEMTGTGQFRLTERGAKIGAAANAHMAVPEKRNPVLALKAGHEEAKKPAAA
jgi:hypothetical protein